MKPLAKLLLIGLLLLLLALPIAMLQGLVGERQQRGREVAADIARSSSRPQTLVGPLLVVEVERALRRVRMVGEPDALRSVEEIVRERELQLHTPVKLHSDGRLSSERRRRGLFEARVYHAELDIAATFAPVLLPADPGAEVVEQRIVSASLALAVGDARGIRAVAAQLDGAPLAPEPGSGLAWQPAGLQLPLDPARVGAPIAVTLDLQLAGTESLHWLPAGDETRVSLQGDWPHPSFVGQFLPDAPKIDDGGFQASWSVSRLAAQAPQALRACGVQAAQCAALEEAGFGLRLLDPVDRHLKTERAIKYAWLFIVIVFGALFFLELLRPVRLHPLQYGLSGLALALFFLLLLSLSEHIGFGPAYLVAALACVALMGAYLAAPFGSRLRAAAFAALLAALYALLYGVLQSEDYALLMGSLALFGLLATAMLLSRRVDWFGLGARPVAAVAADPRMPDPSAP